MTDSELSHAYNGPKKQETPWNFWSRLKIPGAHCDRKSQKVEFQFNHICENNLFLWNQIKEKISTDTLHTRTGK